MTILILGLILFLGLILGLGLTAGSDGAKLLLKVFFGAAG